MASKKPKEPTLKTLPPMFAPVDVAKALASEEAWSRFLSEFQRLDDSGVLDRLFRVARSEWGAWYREHDRWPAKVSQIATALLTLASDLEHTAMLVRCRFSPSTQGTATLEGLDQGIRMHLQRLLDSFDREAKEHHMSGAQVLAGLTSQSSEFAAFGCYSGAEAAAWITQGVRRAILGKFESPFVPFLASPSAKKAMRTQVGRARPQSPADLLHDDVQILNACREGELSAKQVAKAAGYSESHVSKRKRDLREWGLLADEPSFVLSPLGRLWLQSRPSGLNAGFL